uniref:Uncharacterized protein n=1 Tax=Timema cristinae TaxID=61476 RepID=A0A7R9DA52_TIMCR|nr:unnamed protein product [Timema cristinae]
MLPPLRGDLVKAYLSLLRRNITKGNDSRNLCGPVLGLGAYTPPNLSNIHALGAWRRFNFYRQPVSDPPDFHRQELENARHSYQQIKTESCYVEGFDLRPHGGDMTIFPRRSMSGGGDKEKGDTQGEIGDRWLLLLLCSRNSENVNPESSSCLLKVVLCSTNSKAWQHINRELFTVTRGSVSWPGRLVEAGRGVAHRMIVKFCEDRDTSLQQAVNPNMPSEILCHNIACRPDGIKFRSKLELTNYLGDAWDLTQFNFRLGKTLLRAHKGKRKTPKSSIEKHGLNKSETSTIERMEDVTEPLLMLYPIKFLTNGSFNWTEDMEVLEMDGLPDDNINISSTFSHKEPNCENMAKASGQIEIHENGFINNICESYLTPTIDKTDDIKEESKCCRTGMESPSSRAGMEESWPNVKKGKQVSVVDLTAEEPSSRSGAPSLKYTSNSERSVLKINRDNISISESNQLKLEKNKFTHAPIVARKKKKILNSIQFPPKMSATAPIVPMFHDQGKEKARSRPYDRFSTTVDVKIIKLITNTHCNRTKDKIVMTVGISPALLLIQRVSRGLVTSQFSDRSSTSNTSALLGGITGGEPFVPYLEHNRANASWCSQIDNDIDI